MRHNAILDDDVDTRSGVGSDKVLADEGNLDRQPVSLIAICFGSLAPPAAHAETLYASVGRVSPQNAAMEQITGLFRMLEDHLAVRFEISVLFGQERWMRVSAGRGMASCMACVAQRSTFRMS